MSAEHINSLILDNYIQIINFGMKEGNVLLNDALNTFYL